MCTVAAIPIVTAVIGGATAVYGISKRAEAEEKAKQAQATVKKKQADLALANAARADALAADELNIGATRTAILRTQAKNIIGQQRATLAKGNVRVSEGSALDLVDDTERAVGWDAFIIRHEAVKAAEARGVEAENFRGEADVLKLEGAGLMQSAKYAGEAGNWDAFSTFASSTGQVADKWYKHRKATGSWSLLT